MKTSSRLVPVFLSASMILFTSGFSAYPQDWDQVRDKISIQLEEFNHAYPQEKIYIHFDKPFYIPGETVWYKAYYVNAAGNTPSSLSNIIYVELLGDKGEVIIRQILKVTNGSANGEFLLPESLLQGSYQLRAYTNWMRNFDQGFFFTKKILLFNPQKEYVKSKADSFRQEMVDEHVQEKINLQFFPEGGYLVSGLTSKVAFKATNGSGKGIYVKGQITDQDGNVIIPFESYHLGMGAFFLTPETGKTYFANIIQENDQGMAYVLPDVSEEGLVMSVDNSLDDVIRIFIQANDKFLNDHAREILIVVQAAGKIHYSSAGKLNSISSLTSTIPKKNLPAGIIQLTLFSADGNPECERLVFIKQHPALRVRIETDKKSYHQKEKVLLDISVSDSKGNPVKGNFSLAVTDAGQVVDPANHSDNILTNLLLTSELKGTIEEPAFYFMPDNACSDTALDCLMLTQGWRRFLWKEILNDEWPAIHFDFEKNVIVRQGQVLYPFKNAPETLTRVSCLMLKSKKPYNSFTDKNGIFHFPVNAAYGEESLFFDVTDTKGQLNEFKIIFENDLPAYRPAAWNDILFLSPEIKNCLKKRKEKAQIESSFNYSAENNIFYNANPEICDLGTKTSGYFETADYAVSLEKYNPFPTMAEVFREIVTHVSLQYKKGGNKIRIYSDENMRNFDRQPLFLIDGIPTFNKAFVLNLDPGIVETIEVINSTRKILQFGFLGQYGIVAITTKNGSITSEDIPDNNIIKFQGFYNAREFYAPEYGNSTDIDKSKPDLRSLIYWNPLLITDSVGKASVSFYNTDNITKVDISIEGVSYNGIPGLAGYAYDIIPR